MSPLSAFVRGLQEGESRARAGWDPRKRLSPWQLRLFEDPAELRIADAGRRSGKTTEFCTEALDLCQRKRHGRVAIFTKSEVDTRDIFWTDLWALIDEHQLGAISRKSTLYFPNGSSLRLTGAKDQSEAQRRFRGRGYDLVIGDECQLLPWLKEMIQQAIRPAMLRHGHRGRLLLGGTPGEVPGMGYWEEICAGLHGEWSTHTATIYDNPCFNDIVEKALADFAKELGGPQSPVFRREYLRERVPPDESSGLVYRYNKATNDFTELPIGGRWRYVIAVDLGSRRDTNGIVVIGVTDAAPGKAWLVDELLTPLRLPLPKLADEIKSRQLRFPPVISVIDEGGLGGMIADELNREPYYVGVTAAEKMHPLASSDAINGGLLNGTLMIPAKSRLAQDLVALRWDPVELAKGKRKLAKFPHSDLEPPLRYAWPTVADLLASVKAPARPKTDEDLEQLELKRLRNRRTDRRRW